MRRLKMGKSKKVIKEALKLTDKELLLVKVEIIFILATTLWVLTLSGN
jgi:hypothetical protein